MTVLDARDLNMTYRAPVREEGVRAAMVSLFKREYREVQAVQDLSLQLGAAEVVGFIGPNGAGKTTTLKILSGVLHPTRGQVSVLGYRPWRREKGFLRQIALIRGSQPLGGPAELTVMDALRFQQLVYQVAEGNFDRNLHELNEMLELDHLLQRQVRALSLGERMRAGLALSLLYRPRVLFLDEPTIGLDVSAVVMVRRFIADYARETGATVLLTSHYLADVDALCQRVVLIDQGKIRYDGNLDQLARTLSPYKLLRVTPQPGCEADWTKFGEVTEINEGTVSLRIRREAAPAITADLLATLPVADLSVEDPPLETVIDELYRHKVS